MKYYLTKFTERIRRQGMTAAILALAIVPLLSGCPGGSGSGANVFGAGDTEGPISITITAPAAGGTLETSDASVSLTGTADSDAHDAYIVSVSWENDKGGEGQASGGEFWRTGTIPLQVGDNRITITAKDSNGQLATRTLVIKREGEGTGSVTLTWAAPTSREDGTPLTDLAGYRIHYGRMSEIYDYEIEIDNPGIVSYVVEGLVPGKWYFVLSAFDSEGLESNFSNEVKVRVD